MGLLSRESAQVSWKNWHGRHVDHEERVLRERSFKKQYFKIEWHLPKTYLYTFPLRVIIRETRTGHLGYIFRCTYYKLFWCLRCQVRWTIFLTAFWWRWISDLLTGHWNIIAEYMTCVIPEYLACSRQELRVGLRREK